MSVTLSHTFNPEGILVGTRRKKAPGGVRATRLGKKTMYAYAHTAVKGIVRLRAPSLLGTVLGRDHGELRGLLGFDQIARRDGGGVGPELSISDHVSGRYARYVGGFADECSSQDKDARQLAGYPPADCLDSRVMA